MTFQSFATIVFLLGVLPKAVLYSQHGNAVFLAQDVGFRPVHVNAALIAIALFVLGLSAASWFPRRWSAWTAEILVSQGSRPERSDVANAADGLVKFWLLPLSVMALGGFVWATLASGGTLLQKTGLSSDGLPTAYVLQKTAQIAKVAVYVFFVRLVADPSPLSRQSQALLGAALMLTVLVFVLSGHRSGVFILLLQLLLIFQYRGAVSGRYLLIGLGVFLTVNVAILFVRDTPENTEFQLVNLLRRYFFEMEKITGLLMVAETYGQPLSSPWAVVGNVATDVDIQGSLHRFLGNDVLQSISAVPPTVLGEALLYWGGVFILPMAVLLGHAARLVETWSALARNPWCVVIGTMLTATGAFLLLNTDVMGFLKRAVFELGLIVAAWISLWLYRRVAERPTAR